MPNTTHWDPHSGNFQFTSKGLPCTTQSLRNRLSLSGPSLSLDSFQMSSLSSLKCECFCGLGEMVPRCIIPWPLLLYGHWLSAQWQTQPPLHCSSISPDCHLNTEDLDMETSDLRTPPTQTSPQHPCYLFLGCLTLCECHIVRCLHAGYPDVMDQLDNYVRIYLFTSVCFS